MILCFCVLVSSQILRWFLSLVLPIYVVGRMLCRLLALVLFLLIVLFLRSFLFVFLSIYGHNLYINEMKRNGLLRGMFHNIVDDKFTIIPGSGG